MLKILTNSILSVKFPRFFSFNPEYLEKLQRLVLMENSAQANISEQFSQAVSNFRINGTYKKTKPNRLKQTEFELLALLAEIADKPIMLLDLGASDGVTTLELSKALEKQGLLNFKIVLGDVSLALKRKSFGLFTEYLSENNEPVLVKCGILGLELSKHRHEQNYSVSRLAKSYLKLNFLRQRMKQNGEVSLLSPFVLKSDKIAAEYINCLEQQTKFTEKFNAVRAANVLNLSYFPNEQLIAAVSNINQMLKNKGVLLISRNENEESENGSVWIKLDGKLVWHKDFGQGSEIKNLVNKLIA